MRTINKPIWWRVWLTLPSCFFLAIVAGRSLIVHALRPIMAIRSEQIEARRIPGWRAYPLPDDFVVDFPGRPEHKDNWVLYDDANIRYGFFTIPIHNDQIAWRWNFWGETLADARGCYDLHPCHQSGLDGIEFRDPRDQVTTRMLIGPHNLFVLSVKGPEEDLRAAQYLNSLRTISK